MKSGNGKRCQHQKQLLLNKKGELNVAARIYYNAKFTGCAMSRVKDDKSPPYRVFIAIYPDKQLQTLVLHHN